MPWTPVDGPDARVRDPRLGSYRDRAGVLHDVGTGTTTGMVVLLRSETTWSRVSGHLWWSRWSPPAEGVRVSVWRGDRRVGERVSRGEELTADLGDWAVGSFRHLRSTYQVVWQDDDESARLSTALLGRSPQGPRDGGSPPGWTGGA